MFIYNIIRFCCNNYPQILLRECNYAVKKKKIINFINEELNIDESDDESDNHKSDESNKY